MICLLGSIRGYKQSFAILLQDIQPGTCSESHSEWCQRSQVFGVATKLVGHPARAALGARQMALHAILPHERTDILTRPNGMKFTLNWLRLLAFYSVTSSNWPNQDKFNWVIFKKKSYPNEVKLTYRRLPISVIFTNPYLIMLFKRNPSKFVKFFGTYWNISAIASNLPKVFSEISIWRYRP